MNKSVNCDVVSQQWKQIQDYLLKKGRQMKSEYTRKQTRNSLITSNALNEVVNDIHEQLDFLTEWISS